MKPLDIEAPEPSSRREEVVSAALELLARHGVRGVTHRAIDRHLGRPLGSASNYFRRSNDLLAAVAARIGQLDLDDAAFISEAFADSAPVTIERATDLLASLFERFLRPEYRSRTMARLEILVEIIRNAELRAATEGHFQRAEDHLLPVFERLGSDNPTRSANLFLRLLSSTQFMILADEAPDTLFLKTLLRDWLTVSINMTAHARPS